MRSFILTDEDIIRFTNKFPIGGEGCWEWQAGLFSNGYGQFWVKDIKETVGAHRVSYQLFNGELIDGLVVMHSCDNPKCVNPGHLELGTYVTNNIDSIKRGRWKRFSTHCKGGHEFSEQNTRWRTVTSNGKEYDVRVCLMCKKIAGREGYLRRKASA